MVPPAVPAAAIPPRRLQANIPKPPVLTISSRRAPSLVFTVSPSSYVSSGVVHHSPGSSFAGAWPDCPQPLLSCPLSFSQIKLPAAGGHEYASCVLLPVSGEESSVCSNAPRSPSPLPLLVSSWEPALGPDLSSTEPVNAPLRTPACHCSAAEARLPPPRDHTCGTSIQCRCRHLSVE